MELQLFLRASESGRERECRRAADLTHVGAQDLAEVVLAYRTLVLRLEPDVDRGVVRLRRAARAAHRRVRVLDLGARADHSRDLFGLERRVVEVRPGRRLDGDVQFALIRHRHEGEPADRDLEHDREHERCGGEGDHRPAVIERPRDDRLVAVGLAVEPQVEPLERARDRIAMLVRLELRIGPIRREHRVERERDEERHEHRGRDRQRERLEPLARDARHEADRHEHGDDGERRRRDGEADLVGPFVRRGHVVGAHLDVPHDVLAHDDRVVDENAYRERQAQQRHRVEGEAEHQQRDERRKHRHRERESGDHRRSPRIQEEEHDEHREQRAFDERLFHVADRVANAHAGVAHDLDPRPGRHEPLQAVDARPHAVGHGRRAVLARLHDVETDRLTPAVERGRQRLRGPRLDAGHLAERDELRRSARR